MAEPYNPLKDHPIHETLKGLLGLEGRKELDQGHYGLKPVHVHALGRIFSVAHNAKLVLKKVDVSDIDINAANDLNTGLSKAHNELNAFVSNGNATHVDTARNHVNGTAAPQLQRLLPIGFEVHPKTETALESYKAKARKANQDFQRSAKANREQISKLEGKVESEAQRLSELSSLIDARKADIDKTVSELREADIERVERQSKEMRESIEQNEKSLTEFLDKNRSKVINAIEQFERDSQALTQELKSRRDEARRIVQSVGDLLTTGTYADRATKETEKADFFRYLTVGLFSFGLLIIVSNYLIYAFGAAFGSPVELAESWQALSARVITGAAVTLPAFYTARESARHRTNADIAKQRELELTTLGPFIELLPDEQKSAIRDRLTDRYFGSEVDPHDVKAPIDADLLAKALLDISRKSNGDIAQT